MNLPVDGRKGGVHASGVPAHRTQHGRFLPPSRARSLLTGRPVCLTMPYMKTSITIRLDEGLGQLLEQACRRSGQSRSEVVREALRRQLAVRRFEELREQMLPVAEGRGYVTDDDVFRDVS